MPAGRHPGATCDVTIRRAVLVPPKASSASSRRPSTLNVYRP